jgi:enhancing lycopene biosynthesis protein 2
MKKFAVILAGCGVYDGAEIHEAVLTLLSIDQVGASSDCFAPDMAQHHVINHLTGQVTDERRNVLTEAARIARGQIKPLSQFEQNDYDALVFPGGFGAAKNLCNWAFAGDSCQVQPEVEKAVRAMYSARKPIGAMCIAPVILARILQGVSLTTGQDPSSAGFINGTGNKAQYSKHGEVISDPEHLVFTTPCYMLDASISDIFRGTTNLIGKMMERMNK